MLGHHYCSSDDGLQGEGAMGTVSDFAPHDHSDRPQLWNRFERADLFAPYLDLQAQGVAQRQAAKQLHVPRTTLQAWHSWHDTLAICPHVAQFFQSGPGVAFLHRLVFALPLGCVEVGACGIRLGCLLLTLTSLDRFVAASYGAPQHVNRQVEHAIVDYRHTETPRWAQDMPRNVIPVTQDETFTGGLGLVATEPVSNCIILDHRAQARDQDPWHALMAPALAPLHCEVMQSTSDEAPGLLASVEHQLGAHHSPDLFHVQHELSTAVGAPLATKERAAHQAFTEAKEQFEHAQARLESTDDQPETRGPGRPPKAPMRLEQAQPPLEAASREHERLARQREQVKQSIEAIGQADHFVDLARGGRRHGPLIAAEIRTHIETIRPVAQHEQRSQSSLARIAQAERVGPKMQATMAFVSGYGGQQVQQLDVTPPAFFAMPAQLIPSYDLDRVAHTRTVSDGAPLRELARRLRLPRCAPGGALRPLRPETQRELHQQARELAELFQRSSANVEGRNGSLSLRNHQLRGLDLPRKRACLTTIHHCFLTHSDGTTAAARFFAQKPRSMFAAILDSVDLPPAPRRPQRRF
jgi:Family of unknown function (DUF6399)